MQKIRGFAAPFSLVRRLSSPSLSRVYASQSSTCFAFHLLTRALRIMNFIERAQVTPFGLGTLPGGILIVNLGVVQTQLALFTLSAA